MKKVWQRGDPIYCPECDSRMIASIEQAPRSIMDSLNDREIVDIECSKCEFKTTKGE